MTTDQHKPGEKPNLDNSEVVSFLLDRSHESLVRDLAAQIEKYHFARVEIQSGADMWDAAILLLQWAHNMDAASLVAGVLIGQGLRFKVKLPNGLTVAINKLGDWLDLSRRFRRAAEAFTSDESK